MAQYTPYYPGGWKNSPDNTTPIRAAALNRIDDALYDLTAPRPGPVKYRAVLASGPTESELTLSRVGDTVTITCGLFDDFPPASLLLPAGFRPLSGIGSMQVPLRQVDEPTDIQWLQISETYNQPGVWTFHGWGPFDDHFGSVSWATPDPFTVPAVQEWTPIP